MSKVKPLRILGKVRRTFAIIGWLIWYIVLDLFTYATTLTPATPVSVRRKPIAPRRVPLWVVVFLARQKSRTRGKDLGNDY